MVLGQLESRLETGTRKHGKLLCNLGIGKGFLTMTSSLGAVKGRVDRSPPPPPLPPKTWHLLRGIRYHKRSQKTNNKAGENICNMHQRWRANILRKHNVPTKEGWKWLRGKRQIQCGFLLAAVGPGLRLPVTQRDSAFASACWVMGWLAPGPPGAQVGWPFLVQEKCLKWLNTK